MEVAFGAYLIQQFYKELVTNLTLWLYFNFLFSILNGPQFYKPRASLSVLYFLLDFFFYE